MFVKNSLQAKDTLSRLELRIVQLNKEYSV
ncbi:hypothetical protein J2S21_002887 [Peribacillus cavernae]|nr:hypothetical protein [Peribacillus cavernae]